MLTHTKTCCSPKISGVYSPLKVRLLRREVLQEELTLFDGLMLVTLNTISLTKICAHTFYPGFEPVRL